VENKVCSAFGHREILREVKDAFTVLERMVEEDNVTIFMTGGMGEFDKFFSLTVRALKKRHSKIELVLVRPYFSNELNRNKIYYQSMYDSIIIPDELQGIHYKSAILARNKWMVDRSDFVLAYLFRDFGGAYNTVKYAEKKNKQIIRI